MKGSHVAVLLEDIQSKIDILAENMVSVLDEIKIIKADLSEMKETIFVHEASIKHQGRRITFMEDKTGYRYPGTFRYAD